ncbi:magnesium-translocating P-type ATPase [Micromonospora yasonensis]|uniref:magnesium-translocating P-type ATPase n=1 Tax=Micromonospora yasonensis TaxID=1128667 RepID=UPI002230B945|nr:magnesium-translocating P-type ATPase [Micromonospora yasonensis]MCW3842271.1 magnesium-translocating P-type ATPase [Micromonospora yasonensis]
MESGVGPRERTGAFWAGPLPAALRAIRATDRGRTDAEADRLLREHGPNQVEVGRQRGWRLLVAQFTSPIILILVAATVLSMAVGDLTDGAIILAIIVASGGLGFWQERAAGRAVDALQARVRVRAEVIRDGREVSVPVPEVVVGDLAVLRPGDVVPADCRLIDAQRLQVDQSTLTGEAFPVEKTSGETPAEADLAGRTNALWMGSHVVSGSGRAVVMRTGRNTSFAHVTARVGARPAATGFERGLTRFGLLLVRIMVVLLAAIFAANLLLGRPIIDSLLFSLALAVGLTPQMLPAIVAVSLSAGARMMATERVIVKRLEAIEDFGAMTVLLTDKTGTLTTGTVTLTASLDVSGRPDDEVGRLARLNAGLQRGFRNPMDAAIMAGQPPADERVRIAEVPYDFTRKRLSLLVDDNGSRTLITKGALSSVLDVCATARTDRGTVPVDEVRDAVQRCFADLSAQGHRVLGLAVRPLPDAGTASPADERGMILVGLLTFQDPPKPDAAQAIGRLARMGISVRLITGDNRHAASHIAGAVGLRGEPILGADIAACPDAELAARVADTAVFAEVDPAQKERVLAALRARGAVVGFVGDGINDSPALHAADVGISVDTAVDVAKQAAAIVLLEKSLDVVADGVRLGRRTFTNTLKYIRVNTSASFGNVVSMSVATLFLPFLPLLPRQVLLLNFLSDIPYTTISTDHADPEQLERARTVDVRAIRRFMLVYGTISIAFDLAALALLRWWWHIPTDVFRAAWFIQFTVTEIIVLMVLRTNRPFLRSRPSTTLLATGALLAAVTVALPYSPLARPLGLAPPPGPVLATLAVLAVGYVAVNELTKRRVPPDRLGATAPAPAARRGAIS